MSDAYAYRTLLREGKRRRTKKTRKREHNDEVVASTTSRAMSRFSAGRRIPGLIWDNPCDFSKVVRVHVYSIKRAFSFSSRMLHLTCGRAVNARPPLFISLFLSFTSLFSLSLSLGGFSMYCICTMYHQRIVLLIRSLLSVCVSLSLSLSFPLTVSLNGRERSTEQPRTPEPVVEWLILAARAPPYISARLDHVVRHPPTVLRAATGARLYTSMRLRSLPEGST